LLGQCIRTRPEGGRNLCHFLNAPDHHCCIYSKRPFECRLYPFVISSEKGQLKVYAHLACPFVQDKLRAEEATEYILYLQDHLSGDSVRSVLWANKDSFPDYSSFGDQLEFLFEIEKSGFLFRQDEVARRLLSRPVALSSRSFVNLFDWKDFFDFRLEEIDGNLCVFADQPIGTFLYWPPLGDALSAKAIEECFARMRAHNKGGSLTRIENVAKEELFFFDEKRYAFQVQGYEYLYYRKDIAALAGVDYKAKRHDANLFLREHDPVYRPFTVADREACLELFERWLDKRRSRYEDDIYRHMLEENRTVHGLVMEHCQALGLAGRVVAVAGKIVAYTFGYRLNNDIFCDLLEVADPEMPGVGAFIFREFCADPVWQDCRFVNAMDDFGMPNVKEAKMSYRPAILEPVYAVTERSHA
ncbi:MAG: DUF2156 domain-containing protein, partial [Candidatus Omnitrophica bacterium]|nr:DUF2156 domain-containing protein [Candidatus Omnitrophota bacterium]